MGPRFFHVLVWSSPMIVHVGRIRDFLVGSSTREATVDGPLVPARSGLGVHGKVTVTEQTAMRHDAVWACCRFISDLVSTCPINVYRDFDGLPLEMPKPPVLVEPGGKRWKYPQWMYATQIDLTRAGNTVGLITERNALGLPARIDLQPISEVTVIQRKGEPEPRYRISGREYDAAEVWHEREYVVAGFPVGLSPVAAAAWTIGEYLSAQQFVIEWFGGGGVPKARLRNTKRVVPPRESALIKDRWKASIQDNDLFVHGADWEYSLVQADQVGTEWLEARRFNLPAICRFFGVPADLIDAAISAPGTVTYQSALQRNLQFLIMHLGPKVIRREYALSDLLPKPRYVKINTDALLRMDPETRQKVVASRIKHRQLTVTEARELENLPSLTPEQEAEFVRLFGAPKEPVSSSGGGDPASLTAPEAPHSTVLDPQPGGMNGHHPQRSMTP